MIVALDTGPLGLIAHPRVSLAARACVTWAQSMTEAGVWICIPEICDYEIRRDALLRKAPRNVELLDRTHTTFTYLPITTMVMQRAAALWAEARQRGLPTADEKTLDADVILAAQAQLLAEGTGDRVIVATENVRRLARFVEARSWQEIDIDG